MPRTYHRWFSPALGREMELLVSSFAHDWPVWARMLPLYSGGHD
jgi:esterase/lipase superfamily enzyme